MNIDEIIVIKQSFIKHLKMTLVCIVMFIASIMILTFSNTLSMFDKFMYTMSILFFGICSFFYIKRQFWPKTILIIDKNSFTYASNIISTGQKIYWDDVIDINISKYATEKFIRVNLKCPEKYSNNLNIIQKLLVRNSKITPSEYIDIYVSCANKKYYEIYEIMMYYWSNKKQ